MFVGATGANEMAGDRVDRGGQETAAADAAGGKRKEEMVMNREEQEAAHNNVVDEKLRREASFRETELDEEEEDGKGVPLMLDLGPQCSLKDQLEKDKDDESLRRWKEQLLGTVDLNSVGEILEPEVKILGLSILSPDRHEMVLPIPLTNHSGGPLFVFKEGSHYSLKFTFSVNHNIVSGLKYTNTVWKTGVKVDSTKEMLGTFSPQPEPYTYVMTEETTPSGIFARGTYSARSKFVDDDNKCYLEINYTFAIKRDWIKLHDRSQQHLLRQDSICVWWTY